MPDSFRVLITNEGLTDLEGIAEYIRRDSPQNALGVAQMIVAAIDSLSSMPERFRLVGKSRKRGSAVHALVVHPFIIYYRIDASIQTVYVLHVIHGARRQPKRFD